MADPVKYNRWSVRGEIAKAFKTSLKRTFKFRKDVSCTISTCTKEDGGDYLCSTVLDIWPRQRKIHLYKGPKHAGLAVKDNIMGSRYKNMLETCFVGGPGFVRFKLCVRWIAKSILTMLRVGIDTWAPKFPVKKAILYMFPHNIVPEEEQMEYYRSTCIGYTLASILEYSGVVVLQRGHIIELHKQRQHVDSVNKRNEVLYHLLGYDVKEEYESFYESYAREALIQSEGILPIGVQKDVLLPYLLSLGEVIIEDKADWIVHVSSVGNRVYFEMFLTAAERAGLIAKDHSECRLSHLGFGPFEGDGFKTFRNRSAELNRLVLRRCEVLVARHVSKLGRTYKDRETLLSNAARALGDGAFMYEYLKNNRLTSYTLSVDQMLNEEGNTAVYLQFTHARIRSIIMNSSKDINKLKDEVLTLKHDDERELGLHLLRFTEVLEEVCTILAPHILCDYLYGLCNKYSSLESSLWQVVGSSKEASEASKLLLCKATDVVMEKCFQFLGIRPTSDYLIGHVVC